MLEKRVDIHKPDKLGYFHAKVFHSDFAHKVGITSGFIHQFVLTAGVANTKYYSLDPVVLSRCKERGLGE